MAAKPSTQGFSALIGGMNAGLEPDIIRPDQCALALNLTFRGGFASTRPAFHQRVIAFRSVEEKEWFEQGIFQGARGYSYTNPLAVTSGGPEAVIVVVSGRSWAIDLCTYRASEITPITGRSSACGNLSYLAQAGNWMIIGDGISKPILWDGSQSRRAQENEVPAGTIMAFGQGRLWIIANNQLLAGDIITAGENSVIKFTERLILATKGDLSPNFLIGPTTALAFMAQQDTSTGVGSLLDFGINGATSVFAELPRTEWEKGIQRIVLPRIGNTGHRHIAQVNGDIWFRPQNGIRSYRQARAEIAIWGQLPFSTEIEPILLEDTPWLLKHGSMAFFDNRLLTTVCPQTCNGRVWHQGVAALDFNILSEAGRAAKPAWDGFWTGISISQLLTTESQCFAVALDPLGRNCLMELESTFESNDSGDTFEFSGTRSTVDTQCTLISGAWSFDGSGGPSKLKTISQGGVFMEAVQGRIDLNSFYKKDREPCWETWGSFSLCAPMDDCLDSDQECVEYFNPQYRTRLPLPDPEATMVVGEGGPPSHAGNIGPSVSTGYQFQCKHEWSGRGRLSLFFMTVDQADEPENPGCYPPDQCTGARACFDPIFTATPDQPFYIPS